jgi:hypothetical protein
MRVILPVERSEIKVTQDVDFGDVLTFTTTVLILGQTEDTNEEVVGVGRVLETTAKGIKVVEELNKPLPDLMDPDGVHVVNPETEPEVQDTLDELFDES